MKNITSKDMWRTAVIRSRPDYHVVGRVRWPFNLLVYRRYLSFNFRTFGDSEDD
jgi:hypothetical protein